jgi:hypothetical protein
MKSRRALSAVRKGGCSAEDVQRAKDSTEAARKELREHRSNHGRPVRLLPAFKGFGSQQ